MYCVRVAAHDIGHFGGKHKRRTFALETHFGLEVAEKMPKVNVKQVSRLGHHDVTYSQRKTVITTTINFAYITQITC